MATSTISNGRDGSLELEDSGGKVPVVLRVKRKRTDDPAESLGEISSQDLVCIDNYHALTHSRAKSTDYSVVHLNWLKYKCCGHSSTTQHIQSSVYETSVT